MLFKREYHSLRLRIYSRSLSDWFLFSLFSQKLYQSTHWCWGNLLWKLLIIWKTLMSLRQTNSLFVSFLLTRLCAIIITPLNSKVKTGLTNHYFFAFLFWKILCYLNILILLLFISFLIPLQCHLPLNCILKWSKYFSIFL